MKFLHFEKFWPLFLLVSFSLPLFPRAEAKFFDVVEKLFGDSERASRALSNSQLLPLLEAPRNFDPLSGKGGGDIINVVGGSALLALTGPLGSMADVVERKPETISLYVVREGDNLLGISKMFGGVTVNTIRWANNLTTSTVIKPGQILVILPIPSILHTVAKGETLGGIVKKYGGDLNETLAFNEWPSGYEPEVGTTVIIPNGEGEPLSSSGGKAARGAGGPAYSGYYIRPISGGRISQGLHGYNAKDFATYCGAPVVASARGTVIVVRSSGWNGAYGLYLVIAHPNGTQTLYSHMSRIAVSVGWNVAQGQVIGYVGSTGNSTGCHVHLEIRGAAFPNI